MFLRLFLLFTLIPLVELYLLIRVGTLIGALPTLGIVIATGIAGGLLARDQGLATLERVRAEFRLGRIPTDGLFDGLLILIAAVVLITPGLLTDGLGFLLLIPWTRQMVKHWLRQILRKQFAQGSLKVQATEVRAEWPRIER